MTEQEGTVLLKTTGFCEACQKPVPAELAERAGKVFLHKHCPQHGFIEELYEEDSAYQHKKIKYDRAATPTGSETVVERGCPYDCGLCPNHNQHTCIGIIEVTNRCDLGCPVCFASSGEGTPLPLATLKKMMRFYWEAEGGKAEILQLSGGEPTTHPDIIKIIAMAKAVGFPFVMLNTNGIRIAEDADFADELAQFNECGFEVYLQFDGFDDAAYRVLRGKPLAEIKRRAVQNLAARKIPITLVTTVAKGVNDNRLGEILTFAMNTDFIRGVNLQPLAYFGRQAAAPRRPITLSGVLGEIERQTGKLIRAEDFIPLPCNVQRVAITYLLKQGGSFVPVTRGKSFEEFAPMVENTFLFTAENILESARKSISSVSSCCGCMSFIKDFTSVLPKGFLWKSAAEKKEYIDTSTFRISVSSFVDMRSFDIESMQKECVHMITEDCRRIPFSAYNMLHRGEANE